MVCKSKKVTDKPIGKTGLELVQHAVDTYKVLDLSDRGPFLKLVHSNSFWKDGILTTEYRQPFDIIAKINAEYAQKMAVSREKNDHCLIWLPKSDRAGHWEEIINLTASV